MISKIDKFSFILIDLIRLNRTCMSWVKTAEAIPRTTTAICQVATNLIGYIVTDQNLSLASLK
jgi:hypothetical protein